MSVDGFVEVVDEDRLAERVARLGERISIDYAGLDPVLVGVLQGSVIFTADLIRHVTVPAEVDFLSLTRFGGQGRVGIAMDTEVSLEGRHVIVVEDIVDTGLTLTTLRRLLEARGVASLATAALIDKASRRIVSVDLEYRGFEVGDEFLLGYGLDWEGRYRNVRSLWAVMDLARAVSGPRLVRRDRIPGTVIGWTHGRSGSDGVDRGPAGASLADPDPAAAGAVRTAVPPHLDRQQRSLRHRPGARGLRAGAADDPRSPQAGGRGPRGFGRPGGRDRAGRRHLSSPTWSCAATATRSTSPPRPSDAVALAARTATPLFASRAVLDEVGVEIQDSVLGDDDDELGEDEIERFREFLADVQPEDFDPGSRGRPSRHRS